MIQAVLSRIIALVAKAQELALTIGIPNILQPGLIKEMVIAQKLDHDLIFSKRDADACDRDNPEIKYEYLSCLEGGTGQIDRMFKEPPSKRRQSLKRITRNRMIYFAIFYKTNPLKLKVIYEVKPDIVLRETETKLDRSSNPISHVGFGERWVRQNGTVVFRDEDA